MRKGVILLLLFLFLSFVQTSFLVHFVDVVYVNLVIAGFVIIALFEPRTSQTGYIAAFIAGFLLELFSSAPFGLWIIGFLAVSYIIKTFVRHYVSLPILFRT